jgi:cyclohexanecarboxyl-CoA dehydrogenase
MDFALTDEQRELVATARSFSEQRLAPMYAQREREACLDRDTLREMGRLGFLGVELPTELGGLGSDCLTAGLIVLCAPTT